MQTAPEIESAAVALEVERSPQMSVCLQQEFASAGEAQLEGELEVAAQLLEYPESEVTRRSGQATVYWAGPYGVAGAIEAGRGRKGLYVIYRAGQIVDSGKADVQDLATRLAQHFEYPVRHGENLGAYRVRLGFIRQARAVNLAEGTVTRSLAKRGLLPLSRRSLTTGRPTRVPNTAPFSSPGGVRLIHAGRIPRGLGAPSRAGKHRRVQIIPKGTKSWEMPPHFWSEAALERALEVAADSFGLSFGEAESFDSATKGYFFFEAWWAPPGSGWQWVRTVPSGAPGWRYETYANAENIRFQLERTTRNEFPSGSVLARSFRWTGSSWIQFKP